MTKLDVSKGFLYREGIQRTDLDCHACGKVFIARLNFDLDGNHEIKCPYCGHIHYRVIHKGVVTGQRFDTDVRSKHDAPTERVWSDQTHGIVTTSAAEYIRSKWLRNDD